MSNQNLRERPMSKMIFVNLPVADLPRAMLLTHDKFRQFTPKKIANAKESTEVLICISAESRDAVDTMAAKAGAAGGVMDPGPKQDYGFMYGRSFEKLDGHILG